jgi:outer membrane protein TolC
LLNLDPAVRLQTPGGPIPLLQLIDPHEPLESLVQTALANRPELSARSAAVAVQETRLRQERVRPFLPVLSAGYSAGGFGGGSNLTDTNFGHFSARSDFDVFAVWSFENLGFGNLARARARQAAVGQAQAELVRAADRVGREVADSRAESAARAGQLEQARRRLRTAGDGYREDLRRIRNLLGRPIELLDSANLLARARQDFVASLVGYDQAQFRLFVALGRPPALIDRHGAPEVRGLDDEHGAGHLR